MSRVLFSVLLLSVSAAGQVSSTLPKGYADREGASRHWAGWSAQEHYAPARCTYCYDRSVFPWSGAYAITRLSLRRDGESSQAFAAHGKRMKVRLSTGGFSPRQPRIFFERNLGQDQAYVFGDANTYRTVLFPSSVEPNPAPAPFETRIHFERPFLVPATAQNLQVDVVVEANSTPAGEWLADAAIVEATMDGGKSVTLGGQCPEELSPPVMSMLWPGADALLFCNTERSGVPVLGILGPRRTTPRMLTPACGFHVYPLVLAAAMSDRSPLGTATFDFGQVPARKHFVGNKLTFQAAVVERGLPVNGEVGLTPAIEVQIGTGYSSRVNFCTVYSYSQDLVPTDPDVEFPAAFVSSRAVIFGVN